MFCLLTFIFLLTDVIGTHNSISTWFIILQYDFNTDKISNWKKNDGGKQWELEEGECTISKGDYRLRSKWAEIFSEKDFAIPVIITLKYSPSY